MFFSYSKNYPINKQNNKNCYTIECLLFLKYKNIAFICRLPVQFTKKRKNY